MALVLSKRKGFVRESVLAGASLVPCVAFGENELYRASRAEEGSRLARFQHTALKFMGFAMPIFNGRSIFYKGGGLMPARRSVNVVVGAPIAPPPESAGLSPDSAEMREVVGRVHEQYVTALRELYAAHKDAEWNVPGLKRTGTLNVIK